jgi:hypothetical protein
MEVYMRGNMEVAFTFWKLYRDTLWARYGKELDPCSREFDVVIKTLYAIRRPTGLSLGVAIAGTSNGKVGFYYYYDYYYYYYH